VFVTIFIPVWAHEFGKNDREKSVWLNVLMLAAVIGVVLGYMLTALCINNYVWQTAYHLQLILLVAAMIPFAFIPNRYMDVEHGSKRNSSVLSRSIFDDSPLTVGGRQSSLGSASKLIGINHTSQISVEIDELPGRLGGLSVR
jgi:dipeptide/tripeptide permease